MKSTFLIFFALCAAVFSGAQNIPDTIWVEPLTDTSFVVAIGTKNNRNNKMNVDYIDQVFDSAGVAAYAFSQIERNEQSQREADLIKLKADALTALYSDVNSILQSFTGSGYLVKAFQQFKDEYVGFYRATSGGSSMIIRLDSNATAIQVNAQGQPVENGLSGTWDIVNGSRFRLKNFFPTNILPNGSVFNRLEAPDNAFMAAGSKVLLMKIDR